MHQLRALFTALIVAAALATTGAAGASPASSAAPRRDTCEIPSVPEAWSPEGRAPYTASVPEAWSPEGRRSSSC